MSESIFNANDIHQMENMGIKLKTITSQLEQFENGIPFLDLKRPCIIGDGIQVLAEKDLSRLRNVYDDMSLSERSIKFVPASGAATRMFKELLHFYNLHNQDNDSLRSGTNANAQESQFIISFLKNLKHFAFYEALKKKMAENGLDIKVAIENNQPGEILQYLLFSKGLNYAYIPKGLIIFHQYSDQFCTAFAEHLREAKAYTKDKDGVLNIHFTISPAHEQAIRGHLRSILPYYQKSGAKEKITLSIQKHSTDTIAVDLKNRPLRDHEGRLIFRPGGHGALLENLNDLHGDIIFLKNIDNVAHAKFQKETFFYKKAFGAYLIEIQNELFFYIERLLTKQADELLIKNAFEFAGAKLSFIPPDKIFRLSIEGKRQFLISLFNRPLRICGMVKNEGESGGGPFWVKSQNKSITPQIVESSQVDMSSSKQKSIWEKSTHFNPVDLVCGVRDYAGRPFNLMEYSDPDTAFISIKSKDGKELKALEHPGLWNGAMSRWNTIFVEVPLFTFNPVKTVVDLLREAHQPDSK